MSISEDDDSLSRINISKANAMLPRKVAFAGASAKALSGAFLVLLVGTLGYSWISYSTLRTIHIRDVLRHEGSTTDGIVTASEANHSGVYVKYRFAVDGVSYSGQAEMKANGYRAPGSGEAIQLLYAPENPDINLPSSWVWFSVWDLIPFLFVLFTTTASAVVIAVALRERQLARKGIVVEGRVTGCAPNQKAFTVYYEFTTRDDAVMEGSEEGSDECQIGDPIPIIYLRNNPKRNGRYPIADFQIVDQLANGSSFRRDR